PLFLLLSIVFFYFFLCFFCLPSSLRHRALHSFPTRRSSDLPTSLAVSSRTESTNASFSALLGSVDRFPAVAAVLVVAGVETPERSEEHTSELQSRFDLVCRLLLEKKKKITCEHQNIISRRPR